MSAEDRCTKCGALLASDAQWCGQCLAPVVAEPEPAPEPAHEPESRPGPDAAVPAGAAGPAPGSPAPGSVEPASGSRAEAVAAYWACPVCKEENALDATLCSVCGTPFARLFDEDSDRPRITRSEASRAGLVPGLGHIRLGKSGEGIARIFVFAMSISFLLMFVSADNGSWSVGVSALYLAFSCALVAESSLDAGRAAAGERPLISARNLLWVAIGMLGLSVAIVVMLSVGVRPEGQ